MDTITPNTEQQAALDKIHAWLDDEFMQRREFVLAGLAGTGKTSLMRLVEGVAGDRHVHFLAPTNKAASVLRSKGIPASTIHSTFYQVVGTDEDRGPVFEFSGAWASRRHLFVIDEASMIDTHMLDDLRSTEGMFLYVGDHGQLPPVGDDPGLLRNADVKLEHIHRQAEGNEILAFAHHLRQGGDPFEFRPTGATRDVMLPAAAKKLKARPNVCMWLCWRNYTRVQINMWLLHEAADRDVGFGMRRPAVVPVQIRGNYPEHQLYNGEVYNAEGIDWDRRTGHPDSGHLQMAHGEMLHVRFHPSNWHQEKRSRFGTKFEHGVLADYGFAITVHTSQGSEWERIVVVDEAPESDAARWRYTAATRARQQVIWLPFNALPIKAPPIYSGVF